MESILTPPLMSEKHKQSMDSRFGRRSISEMLRDIRADGQSNVDAERRENREALNEGGTAANVGVAKDAVNVKKGARSDIPADWKDPLSVAKIREISRRQLALRREVSQKIALEFAKGPNDADAPGRSSLDRSSLMNRVEVSRPMAIVKSPHLTQRRKRLLILISGVVLLSVAGGLLTCHLSNERPTTEEDQASLE